jgi:hypothetical protein
MLVQVRGILRERPEDGGTRPFRLWQGLARARPDPHSPPGQAQGAASAPLGGLGGLLPPSP